MRIQITNLWKQPKKSITTPIMDGWEMPLLGLFNFNFFSTWHRGFYILGISFEFVTTDMKCIKCGCTELKACPAGCRWVQQGKCSSCFFIDEFGKVREFGKQVFKPLIRS